MRKTLATLLLFSLFMAWGHANTRPTVYQIDIRKEIGATTWIYLKKGFSEATKAGAKLIIIRLNTYGGEVVYADSMRTRILNSKIPVIAFVDNNAASAGALIAIACQKIYMRAGASLGAATVVDQTGGQMPDKYQSYMRATIRSTAEAHGKETIISGKDTLIQWRRDPHIAEAMVDNRIAIPNVVDAGRTLTFTTDEAIKNHYCEGKAESVDDILSTKLGMAQYDLQVFRPSILYDLVGLLNNAFVRALLIMIIIAGIYFELHTPGLGIPIIAAIIAAALYFAPLYLGGSAAGWEIMLFFIGLLLLALEIFVIPGFGLAGISGIILIICGLTLSMIDNTNFDFSRVPGGEIAIALFTVLISIAVAFGLSIYFSNKIGKKGIFRRVALDTEQDIAQGFVGVPTEPQKIVGKIGIAATVLRPSGKVMVESNFYDAVSEHGFIEQGTPIKVTRYEAGQVYVITSEE
jgi:membrane-bound serine protease (ClpP class)